jgi:histidinol-phosphate/aromatic aminotransferase/cobyric acid decarboxylase-like protein
VLAEELAKLSGVCAFPSQANFVYVRVAEEFDGTALRDHLLTEHGCFVRQCGNKLGSDGQFFRIAARPIEEIDILIDALEVSLGEIGLMRRPVRESPVSGPRRAAVVTGR